MRFTCQGHPNLTGTHDKTLELTRALDIGPRATCIVGVGANYDEDALLKLRGEIEVVLEGNGASDSFTATVSPFFLGGDSLVFRRGAGAAHAHVRVRREQDGRRPRPRARCTPTPCW